MKSDILIKALKAGLLVEDVEGSGITYFTEGDCEKSLELFAKLVIESYKNEEITE